MAWGHPQVFPCIEENEKSAFVGRPFEGLLWIVDFVLISN